MSITTYLLVSCILCCTHIDGEWLSDSLWPHSRVSHFLSGRVLSPICPIVFIIFPLTTILLLSLSSLFPCCWSIVGNHREKNVAVGTKEVWPLFFWSIARLALAGHHYDLPGRWGDEGVRRDKEGVDLMKLEAWVEKKKYLLWMWKKEISILMTRHLKVQCGKFGWNYDVYTGRSLTFSP